MKIKDIPGLPPNIQKALVNSNAFLSKKLIRYDMEGVGEIELEIDVERVRRIVLDYGVSPESDRVALELSKAIAKEFPVKVKESK